MQSERQSKSLTLDDAQALFKVGEFAEVVRRSHPYKPNFSQPDPTLQFLIAHAMVMVGNVDEARRLSNVDLDDVPPSNRARAYLVRGLVEHATGALTTAAQHF